MSGWAHKFYGVKSVVVSDIFTIWKFGQYCILSGHWMDLNTIAFCANRRAVDGQSDSLLSYYSQIYNLVRVALEVSSHGSVLAAAVLSYWWIFHGVQSVIRIVYSMSNFLWRLARQVVSLASRLAIKQATFHIRNFRKSVEEPVILDGLQSMESMSRSTKPQCLFSIWLP